MKLFVQLLSYFLFSKFIKTEKLMHMGLGKTKETPKQAVSGKVGSEHEDSSSTNDVIIKISENKKKKSSAEKEGKANHKSKKQTEKTKPVAPSAPQVPDPESTYQVPTSNILFKDLDSKKVQIPEKDYNELLESNKLMMKMMTEFNKQIVRSNNTIRKIQNLNPSKEDSKPRDLFNIKVIEVSDDVKSSK